MSDQSSHMSKQPGRSLHWDLIGADDVVREPGDLFGVLDQSDLDVETAAPNDEVLASTVSLEN